MMSRCLRIAVRCSRAAGSGAVCCRSFFARGAESRCFDETVEMVFGTWVRTRYAQLRKLRPGGGPQCASGTHLRHTVELFVSRWWSAVPQGRICVTQWSCRWWPAVPQGCICVTQWSCSCPGGGAHSGWCSVGDESEDVPLYISRETLLKNLALEEVPRDFAEIAEKFVDYGFFL